jgi:CelD/BcsL family acetyltransferase involved in cellulose biosynthesis
MFRIQVENDFDFAGEPYRRLFERSRGSAFQHPLWLDALYRLLAPLEGAEPLAVVARRWTDQEPALVLPLMRRRRHGLRLVEFADLRVSDYAMPVCDDATFAALVADPGARARICELLRPFDLLRIKKAPDGVQPLERLFPGAARKPMNMSAHAVALPASYPEWETGTLSKTFGKQLRKKRRRLEREGEVRFELLQDPAEIVAHLADLQRLRAIRFPDDFLQEDSYFHFYTRVALEGAAAGFARAYRLSLNGRSVGGSWGLSDRGRFLVLISGFDYASWPGQSLGVLCYQDIARDGIARGDTVLDFTGGDEDYKRDFGTRPTGLSMVTAHGSGLGMLAKTFDPMRSRRAVVAAPAPEPMA